MRWAGIKQITQAICAEIGAAALAAKTVNEEEWVAYFEEHIGEEHLARAGRCASQRSSAKAASSRSGTATPASRWRAPSLPVARCPACFRRVTIDGRRYTDGGVRSGRAPTSRAAMMRC